MTATELLALSPILTLGLLSIVTMLAIAVRRHHLTIAAISAISCLATMATLPLAATVTPLPVTILLIIDGFALFYMGLLLGATVIVIALSYGYLELYFADKEEFEEFYLLLLIATFGGLILVSAAHFATFFFGIELLGVSLYSLIGYMRTRRAPLEAAVKYLLLSASASAFLLFGMALMYFQMGAMAFNRMGVLVAAEDHTPALWLAGFVLVVVGVGFKLGLAPFHLWIPDVYQGAPAPVTAYVATVSKGAVFAVLLRFVGDVHALQLGSLSLLFGLLAAASMFVGNLLALQQQNVKRLLAYSSIAHIGYLLVAMLAGGPAAAEAVTFYLVAYFVSTLGAFGVVTVLSRTAGDAEAMEDYRGLFWTRPWPAGLLMLMLLSLTGIPLTAGFMGKFYVIAAGLGAGLWLLVILLIVNSAIGAYYYLRLILMMVEQPARDGVDEREWRLLETGTEAQWMATLSLGLVASLLIWFGLYPEPLIETIQTMLGPFISPLAAASF